MPCRNIDGLAGLWPTRPTNSKERIQSTSSSRMATERGQVELENKLLAEKWVDKVFNVEGVSYRTIFIKLVLGRVVLTFLSV